MPAPDVPWGGRDTSALTHEQIYRWVHDGADPGALENARAQHAAHGEELRVAARRLESAHAELTASWQGRDADAATAHVRSLVARMTGLGDTVTGQAGSLAGVRDALSRVQSAVRPPRPPALPVLGAPPPDLPGRVVAGPQDGFAAFQAAQDEELAAQAAYRAYLEETSAAARAAPTALGGPAAAGGPARPAAAPGRGGALARAAGTGPGGEARPAGAPPTVADTVSPGGHGSVPVTGARGVPGGPGPALRGAAGTGRPPTGGTTDPATRPGMLGRLVARLTGGPEGAGGPPGVGGPTGRTSGPTALGSTAPGSPGTGPAPGPSSRPAGRSSGRQPSGRPVEQTAADRLHGTSPDDRTPATGDTTGGTVAAGAPDATTTTGPPGPGALAGAAPDPPPAPAAPAPAPPAGAPAPPPVVPPLLGPVGPPVAADGPAARRPEYLVEVDPLAEPDDPTGRRRVSPPVLGHEPDERESRDGRDEPRAP